MSVKLQVKKSATATLNPEKQNLESIHRIVDRILGMAGCGECGRLAILKIDFVVNPAQDLGRDGVISFEKQGF